MCVSVCVEILQGFVSFCNELWAQLKNQSISLKRRPTHGRIAWKLDERDKEKYKSHNNQGCPERERFQSVGRYLGCLACYEPGWESESQRLGSPTAPTPSSVGNPWRRNIKKEIQLAQWKFNTGLKDWEMCWSSFPNSIEWSWSSFHRYTSW